MRRLLLALICLFVAARAEAIPIHPNTISVEFGAITFSHQLPSHVIFQMIDGIFGASPSTGFFGGGAGYLGLDGDAPPAFDPIEITIDATVRLWNSATPTLVAIIDPAVFHTTLLGDGTTIAVFPAPSGPFFSAASVIYIVGPNSVQAMHWDSHVPQTIEAVDITAVPEPTTLLLVGTGLITLHRRHSFLHKLM